MQKTEIRSIFVTLYNIKSKWIKSLDIIPQTLTLVQERIGNTMELIGMGNDFLNRT
jgi:hypothetical protein